jgi:hypothetical protein
MFYRDAAPPDALCFESRGTKLCFHLLLLYLRSSMPSDARTHLREAHGVRPDRKQRHTSQPHLWARPLCPLGRPGTQSGASHVARIPSSSRWRSSLSGSPHAFFSGSGSSDCSGGAPWTVPVLVLLIAHTDAVPGHRLAVVAPVYSRGGSLRRGRTPPSLSCPVLTRQCPSRVVPRPLAVPSVCALALNREGAPLRGSARSAAGSNPLLADRAPSP